MGGPHLFGTIPEVPEEEEGSPTTGDGVSRAKRPGDKSGNSTKKNGLANKQLNGTNQRLDDPSNPKFNTTTGQTVELGKPAREFPPTEEENLSTNQPSPGVVTTTTTPKPNQGPGGSPMLIQKQNSSQASPSPHFSPVPQIQVIDPNIELMKKQEAEKLRIQKEQLENQQKQLAEQQANAQRQQAEMV